MQAGQVGGEVASLPGWRWGPYRRRVGYLAQEPGGGAAPALMREVDGAIGSGNAGESVARDA